MPVPNIFPTCSNWVATPFHEPIKPPLPVVPVSPNR